MADEKVDAWMPLWIGAYLADTMNLTTQQHGAYLLILFAYWRNKGPLPDDDEDMAAITKASPAEWKKLRPKIAKFFDVADGVWTHGRAEKELASAGQRKAKASGKGKAGAEARWGKTHGQAQHDGTGNGTGNGAGIGEALPWQCPTPSPTPLPSGASVPDGTGDADAPPPVDKSEDRKREAWRTCGNWFVENGVAEGTARELMGKVAREYPAVAVDACLAAAKKGATPDPSAYLIATAKQMAGEQRTVPSDAADRTAAYLAEQARQREASKTPEAEAARLATLEKAQQLRAAA